MDEVYNKLNYFLNEICIYLEYNNSVLLENILPISKIIEYFYVFIKKYQLNDNMTIQNNLTFMDVYNLTREIIEQIDTKYLEDFDKLIINGELDFNYENPGEISQLVYFKNN